MRKELVAILVLAVFGTGLAAYQTLLYFQPASICVSHCDIVTKSSYASLLGIPLAVIGLAGFSAFAGLAVAGISTKRNTINYIFALATAGLIFIAYLIYLEVAKLNAICYLCTASHLTGAAIWLISLFAFVKKKSVAPASQKTD